MAFFCLLGNVNETYIDAHNGNAYVSSFVKSKFLVVMHVIKCKCSSPLFLLRGPTQIPSGKKVEIPQKPILVITHSHG